MDLLLEAQLQCFKWLWNTLLMGEQAQNQEENRNLLSDILTPAHKVLFFNAGVLAGVKKSPVKLPWHLINISTKIHPPFTDTVVARDKMGILQTCQRKSFFPGLGSSAMKCCVSTVIYKYQMLPFTELRFLTFSSLIYRIDTCFRYFAPVFHYQLIYPGQPWQVSAEPHSLSRICKFRSICITLMNL